MRSLPWMRLHLLKVPPPPTGHTEDQAPNMQTLRTHANYMQPTEKPTSGVLAVGVNYKFSVAGSGLCLSVSVSPTQSLSLRV